MHGPFFLSVHHSNAAEEDWGNVKVGYHSGLVPTAGAGSPWRHRAERSSCCHAATLPRHLTDTNYTSPFKENPQKKAPPINKSMNIRSLECIEFWVSGRFQKQMDVKVKISSLWLTLVMVMKLLFLIGSAGPETNKVVLNEAAFLFLLSSLRKKSQSIIDVYYALLISVIIYSTFTVELIKNYANY